MNELFNINSAVAFFFLFFLHGTSIGTRHQGISYNVPTALRSGGERETNVSDSTKLPKREQNFKLKINPPFCKTDVS